MNLEGKTAVVTGGAKRLGEAIAVSLAENGADVAVCYRESRKEAEAVKARIEGTGRKSAALKADLSKPENVKRLFEAVYNKFGKIDILVNNVGNYLNREITETEPEEWKHIIDTTLNSAFYCCRYCLPHMRRSGNGRIINIGTSGLGSLCASTSETAYKAGKTGILLLTRALAKAEARHGITVNMVSPGMIFNSVVKPKGGEASIPAGRYMEYKDLIPAILFLLSDQAGYITGTNIEVAGGYNL